jgi:hypothetical protein
MNISQAKEQIKIAVQAYTARTEAGTYRIPTVRQRPILLMGPPGVGKTAIMEQVARECGIGLLSYTMTHHTRQSAMGLPLIQHRTFGGQEYAVTEYTMSEIIAAVYDYMEKTELREGILFLDEINCVSETLMPAMLQFLQYKSFGSHKLPEGWIIIGAGNPMRYNMSAKELDSVILDRVKLLEIEADLGVWKHYAAQRRLHPAILAYLTLRPEEFYAVDTVDTSRGFVTARSWEDLSEMMLTMEELGQAPDRLLIGQYIQSPAVADGFAAYYTISRNFQREYQLDRVLAGDSAGVLEKIGGASFDQRLCAVEFLSHRIHTMVDAWRRQRDLTDSLGNFVKATLRQVQAGGDLETLGAEHIQRLELALRTRKNLGVLPPDEEERQQLLIRVIQDGLRTAKVAEPEGAQALADYLTQWETECSGRQTAISRAVDGALDFCDRAFGDSQELLIFLTELKAHKATANFVGAYAAEKYDVLEDRVSPEKREARLRAGKTQ